ncbi:hypothetical protein AB0H73_08055 [Streptomyces olivoreticuli]
MTLHHSSSSRSRQQLAVAACLRGLLGLAVPLGNAAAGVVRARDGARV